MKLEFEYSQNVIAGSDPVLVHNNDNTVDLLYKTGDGKYLRALATTPLGNWKDRTFIVGDMVTAEKDMFNVRAKTITNSQTFFVWQNDGRHRIAAWPDDAPLNSPTTPYRLYFGVDSEKLYMNIADQWAFIGSPNHDLLMNTGALTHDEIDEQLQQLWDAINQLRGQ